MAGLADILSALGIGGSSATPPAQPPQAQTPAAPTGGSPSPTPDMSQYMAMVQPHGLNAALSNPLLQGALGAYFGTISSPRRGGWGEAIGRGGMEGLQTYGQARQQQLTPLLMASNIAKSQAQTGLANTTAGLRAAQTKRLAPNPIMGQHFQVLANDQSQSPTARQIYGMLADGVADGSIDSTRAAQVASAEDMNGAKALLIQAQTGEAKAKTQETQAETGLVPLKGKALQSEVGKNQAEAGLAGAKAGEVPGEEAKTAAEASLASGRAAQLPAEAARTKAQTAEAQAAAEATPAKVAQGAEKLGQTQQAQLQRQAEAAWAARPLAVKAKDELTVSGDPHGEFIKNYIAMHSVPTGTPHTSASGKPIVMGPDGQYHYVNP
jgi:hypothetical protein